MGLITCSLAALVLCQFASRAEVRLAPFSLSSALDSIRISLRQALASALVKGVCSYLLALLAFEIGSPALFNANKED